NKNILYRYAGHERLRELLSKLPTANNLEYELACYLRWAALSAMGGGLLTDYDCVNIGYTPQQHSDIIKGHDIVHFSSCYSPMTYANNKGCDDIIRMFSNYNIQPGDTYDGKPHISDMIIFTNKKPGRTHFLCQNA